ncbi:DMT family transporter [Cellulomonas pakistanensis]|uniref:DMT family transporter n=1 Tax=Cellulomonas pakistanensis TaxID=992287 RepID=UPI001941C04B|nr:SMR family transporter [Cellulomonas pakistanensis]
MDDARPPAPARAWLLLLGAIATEVTGSLALRAAVDHRGWYAVVVPAYVAAFVLLAGVLRAGMGLGVAYGVWGATGVALTAALGATVFGEPFTPVMVAGISLIMVGVLLVELGAQRAHRGRVADASAATAGGR